MSTTGSSPPFRFKSLSDTVAELEEETSGEIAKLLKSNSDGITNFIFCDKAEHLPAVIVGLKGSPTLFLDCEGSRLGIKTRRLSLISLGIPAPTPQKQCVYLIDTLALGTPELRPIFDLLESSDIQKVVFDGQMDQSALFHEHNVTIQSVVDLQLADIKSRRLRGEREGSPEQIGRLWPYLPRNKVASKASLYEKVHKLAGLGQALEEHEVELNEQQMERKSLFSDQQRWIEHPLSRLHLQYAANDINLISRLWGHFVDAGYIDGQLPEQSLRYIRMWNNAQPDDDDVYKRHALLPLAILDAVTSRTKECTVCQRLLPESSFSKTAWDKPKDRKCLVCRAIVIRVQRENQIQDAIEREGDYYDSDGSGF
ncbi:ribonuclease H-like domain-containing protein [Mycena rosella]|uniref:Ribonuclease H-like domain-containing protein n=1 Tax=Mycena rosella TaxID=1033263 RepID=A0AAD7B7U3_MYCRO|nr:ribonuclease H-like domain-containing protein [Mycena rosella]